MTRIPERKQTPPSCYVTAPKPHQERERIAIVFDGKAWYVRRIRIIEHDLKRDEKVYRCDKPLGNDYATLAEVPQVASALEAVRADAFVDEWNDGYDAGVASESLRRDDPEEFERQTAEVKQVLLNAVEKYQRERMQEKKEQPVAGPSDASKRADAILHTFEINPSLSSAEKSIEIAAHIEFVRKKAIASALEQAAQLADHWADTGGHVGTVGEHIRALSPSEGK